MGIIKKVVGSYYDKPLKVPLKLKIYILIVMILVYVGLLIMSIIQFFEELIYKIKKYVTRSIH
jgi:membrane-anchored glycerophosphoryl diester phosphodiesterase (GDPDase)